MTIKHWVVSTDHTILDGIQTSLRCPALDTVMPWITAMGNLGLIWLLLGAALLCTRRYRRYGVMLLCSLALSALFGEVILKNIVERIRPFHAYEPYPLLIAPPRGYSFPSGHTSASFSSAVILFSMDKRAGAAGFVLAALIAFSRLYLYVHYPSDVLAGILLGSAMGLLTLWFFRRFIPENKIKEER